MHIKQILDTHMPLGINLGAGQTWARSGKIMMQSEGRRVKAENPLDLFGAI